MEKEVVKTISREFVTVEKQNYLGHTQLVTICLKGFKIEGVANIFVAEDKILRVHLPYVLSVGVAVQRDGDVLDKELAEKIAEGRASKFNKSLLLIPQTRGGIFDENFRKELLNTIAAKDLDYFSEGYAKAEAKYKEAQKEAEATSKLPDAEKQILELTNDLSATKAGKVRDALLK